MKTTALFTDFYELTMMQGYYLHKTNPEVVFDMFFRRQPFSGGYTVFAGLETLLKALETLTFTSEDIDYLSTLKIFRPEFLDYLSRFDFSGDIYAMDEGTVVFPDEPLIRVHCNLMEAQLVESLLLNIVNFQTLIATKASRIYLASNQGKILEFGLRRAQGLNGALSASRAAFIGGAAATSNSSAGKRFGIPVKGTMAHSWVMAFDSELDAFRKYVEIYPENPILLIDTYDALGSGIENAITIGLELKAQGRSFGVRIDSGDLQYMSMKIRDKLDNAGLADAIITVSNDLDEIIIHQLITDHAPIDLWGVGTQLVTGGNDSSLTGVYKLVAKERNGVMQPTIKVSNNPEKTTNPGIKQVHRFSDRNGSPLGDLIALEEEPITTDRPYVFYHPMFEYKHFTLSEYASATPLLGRKMAKGRICCDLPSLREIQEKGKSNLAKLDYTFRRIVNPHIYKVSLSEKLKTLKFRMIDELT